MKLPFLPVCVDDFKLRDPSVRLFLLTHFHTDHMSGLTPSFAHGLIVCHYITAALLIDKFGSGIAERVVGLPFFQPFTLIPGAAPEHTHRDPTPDTYHGISRPRKRTWNEAPGDVVVQLLPAFHIDGSAMFYFRTPYGTILFTGDLKFTSHAEGILRPFFAGSPVDHLYLDDTWLHLGEGILADGGRGADHAANLDGSSHWSVKGVGGSRVLGRLLSLDQLDEAFEALARRMDRRVRDHEQEFHWAAAVNDRCACRDGEDPGRVRKAEDGEGHCAEEEHHRAAAPQPQAGPFLSVSDVMMQPAPYAVRCYLHNQFGKEVLLQRLAHRLKTRILVDDARYARLSAVEGAIRCGEASVSGLGVGCVQGRRRVRLVKKSRKVFGMGALSRGVDWVKQSVTITRDPRVDLTHFVSWGQLREEQLTLCAQCFARRLPLVEIVGSRRSISAEELERASTQAHGTPFFALVMSGWAKMQRRAVLEQAENVYHIPYTLHSTPDELARLVSLLRPRSVTPLHHHRPCRTHLVQQRLGAFLKKPYVNDFLSTSHALQRVQHHRSVSWCVAAGSSAPTHTDRESTRGDPSTVADAVLEDAGERSEPSSLPCSSREDVGDFSCFVGEAGPGVHDALISSSWSGGSSRSSRSDDHRPGVSSAAPSPSTCPLDRSFLPSSIGLLTSRGGNVVPVAEPAGDRPVNTARSVPRTGVASASLPMASVLPHCYDLSFKRSAEAVLHAYVATCSVTTKRLPLSSPPTAEAVAAAAKGLELATADRGTRAAEAYGDRARGFRLALPTPIQNRSMRLPRTAPAGRRSSAALPASEKGGAIVGMFAKLNFSQLSRAGDVGGEPEFGHQEPIHRGRPPPASCEGSAIITTHSCPGSGSDTCHPSRGRSIELQRSAAAAPQPVFRLFDPTAALLLHL